MRQATWETCDDPIYMITSVRPWSDRKLRLYAVACCRRIWHLFTDRRHRAAIEVAERFADGRATAAERIAAHKEVRPPDGYPSVSVWATSYAAYQITAKSATDVFRVDYYTREIFRGPGFLTEEQRAAQRAQAELVREIYGASFKRHRLRAADRKRWLKHNGGAVATLAESIYDEGRFAELPVLADALVEAGCEDEALLGHLRRTDGHYRGCWALDLLLAKT